MHNKLKVALKNLTEFEGSWSFGVILSCSTVVESFETCAGADGVDFLRSDPEADLLTSETIRESEFCLVAPGALSECPKTRLPYKCKTCIVIHLQYIRT